MKKIINSPESFIPEMLEGLYLAHADALEYAGGDMRCLVSRRKKANKVALATGGGSGHLPLFLGYVGRGMLDGCAIGEVFQSPSAEQVQAVTRHIDAGAGVLYIYGNYNGDIFSFDMAAEAADFEDGIRVMTVLGADDAATPAPEAGQKSTRRGVAGIFFVYKCAGAAAEEGLSLEEVARVAQKAADSVRTMGVALSPCTVPRVGKPGFELAEGEMEMGMGIHGEPGIYKSALKQADLIVDEMLDTILKELACKPGERVAVLVNGLGATPLEEQYIMYRRAHRNLERAGLTVAHAYVGEYVTSMEMAGASISVIKLDGELERFLAAPADTPFFKQL